MTLLDRRNFHLFQPLLYQVATGSLSPGDICAPLRGILSRQRNTRVLLGEVGGIDPAARRVKLLDGAEFEYDSLIVATGSKTSYYRNPEWNEWAPSLKTVEEATSIRHKILYAFEAAERVTDPQERQAWLTFAIVGGGATGVELAGALAEIAHQTLKHDFRSIRTSDARIIILDGNSRVLTSYSEDLSQKANASLVHLGVQVHTGVRVVAVSQEGVSYEAAGGAGKESGCPPKPFCGRAASPSTPSAAPSPRARTRPPPKTDASWWRPISPSPASPKFTSWAILRTQKIATANPYPAWRRWLCRAERTPRAPSSNA